MRTISATAIEMNRLEPKLRNRWNTDMASARNCGGSVQNVITVSGTHDTPIDMPCSMLHSISVRHVDVEVEAHQPEAGRHLQQGADATG